MVYSSLQGQSAQRESAAFTRQRTLVRTQHRPLINPLALQVKRGMCETIPNGLQGLCAAIVQQPEQISRKLEKGFLARMRSLAGVLQAPETTSKLSYCSRM